MLSAVEPTATEILDRAYAEHGVYVVGSREHKVTLYSQQVRALNVVFALRTSGRLPSNSAVAIVGGGVAGVTCAHAAAAIGCSNVSLFEKEQELLPVQKAASGRWLHPQIVDWPADYSVNPSANDLPFLRWSAARAEDVRRQILGEFQSYATGRITIVTDCVGLKIARLASGWSVSSDNRGVLGQFDLVLLAVGFGTERFKRAEADVLAAIEPRAYWDADPVERLGGSYLISGTGDGGLIDLFRVLLTDFDQRGGLADYADVTPDLRTDLAKLRAEILAADRAERDQLLRARWPSIRSAHRSAIGAIQTKLTLRSDTKVTLHGQSGQWMSAGTALLHTLLADALQQKALFRYESKPIVHAERIEGQRYRIQFGSERATRVFDHVILRHGARSWASEDRDPDTLELFLGEERKKAVSEYRDVSALVAAHRTRLDTLQKMRPLIDYAANYTSLRLPGNVNEWWSSGGAPNQAEGRLDATKGPDVDWPAVFAGATRVSFYGVSGHRWLSDCACQRAMRDVASSGGRIEWIVVDPHGRAMESVSDHVKAAHHAKVSDVSRFLDEIAMVASDRNQVALRYADRLPGYAFISVDEVGYLMPGRWVEPTSEITDFDRIVLRFRLNDSAPSAIVWKEFLAQEFGEISKFASDTPSAATPFVGLAFQSVASGLAYLTQRIATVRAADICTVTNPDEYTTTSPERELFNETVVALVGRADLRSLATPGDRHRAERLKCLAGRPRSEVRLFAESSRVPRALNFFLLTWESEYEVILAVHGEENTRFLSSKDRTLFRVFADHFEMMWGGLPAVTAEALASDSAT